MKEVNPLTAQSNAKRGVGTVWLNLGIRYARKGQKEMANRCFIEAIRSNPQNASAWFYLGIFYPLEELPSQILKSKERIKTR